MSKYGNLIERVSGYCGVAFIYRNADNGFTVRIAHDPIITTSTLESARKIARQCAGTQTIKDYR